MKIFWDRNGGDEGSTGDCNKEESQRAMVEWYESKQPFWGGGRENRDILKVTLMSKEETPPLPRPDGSRATGSRNHPFRGDCASSGKHGFRWSTKVMGIIQGQA